MATSGRQVSGTIQAAVTFPAKEEEGGVGRRGFSDPLGKREGLTETEAHSQRPREGDNQTLLPSLCFSQRWGWVC